jgi:hypothetical protein
MRRTTVQRTTVQKPARRATRKPTRRRGTRRAAAKPARRSPSPRIARLEGDVELVAPRGYCASILLKLVDRDDRHRYYRLWAAVGRHDADTVSMRYKYTGEETIRVDLPEGMGLSAKALEPHLTEYIDGLDELGGPTPVIIDD